IHLHIEARLTDLIGAVAGKLHTARSRNDQVATDLRLYSRHALKVMDTALRDLQAALIAQADSHTATILPGLTHLQPAQPIVFGHHLLAYVEMFQRDRARLQAALSHGNESPLGSAALAGTPYPINRDQTAKALGFDRPMANSLDGVASRDFAMEALNALSISAVHLSRLAEEIVLWTSSHFRFARLSDSWSTGSSIMPQKRNPDAAELVRAKAARIASNAQCLMMIVKALPLTYAKDLQDDKAMTFESFDAFMLSVGSMAGMMQSVTFNRDAMRQAATFGFSTATDLADWLVRVLNMPFREAHHVTGAVVKAAEAAGIGELCDVPLATFQTIEPRIDASAIALLSVEASVAARDSYGGTAPKRVMEQVKRLRQALQLDA
ncbi:MAG: argininosuccinate lyase, partial [Hyphomonadaceae bacterium]